MRYQSVCVEALAYRVPEERLSSEEIERRLEPVYRRLRLAEGRLELMTGVVERRLWPRGTMPSEVSAATAADALRQANFPPEKIGALIHGSVSRDYIEPASASLVHARLGLPSRCLVFDISNACLGLMDGVVTVANMIELGQIEAGLVVGTESSRCLIENTIAELNRAEPLSRELLKQATASLTIGSASAAILLVRRELSRQGHRLLGGLVWSDTRSVKLCHGTPDDAGGDRMRPFMWTDSDNLLCAGIAAAQDAFPQFLMELGWRVDEIDLTLCHQVGKAHRKALLEALGLRPERDFTTFEYFGNTGAVALPLTAAIAMERGLVRPGARVALMGIGSGLNIVMLGLQAAG
ncbi:MAG: 3-oxoacyl-ACP synthase III [Thermoguttaceae bacterium]|nr:3-oxoacyl-ACP synthase III [Thermoguttaceae bacterium]MDW8080066.1 3-oxoacyl-ACP synthase III [Thermoguttaceae bacterium]